MERSGLGTDNIGGHDDTHDRIAGLGYRVHLMKRTIRVVRAAIMASGVLLGAWACDAPQTPSDPRSDAPHDSAEQVIFGGRTVLAYNGLRRGSVEGDTVLSFDALTRFEFRGLRAEFTTTLGRPLSTLTAPTGTYRIASGMINVRGKVVIVSDTSRRRIDATAVRFDIAKDQLSSDAPFTATAGARKLSGTGFTADPGLFTVTCLKECTGSLGR
jgi:LPS export ABC transporter protein LptC